MPLVRQPVLTMSEGLVVLQLVLSKSDIKTASSSTNVWYWHIRSFQDTNSFDHLIDIRPIPWILL